MTGLFPAGSEKRQKERGGVEGREDGKREGRRGKGREQKESDTKEGVVCSVRSSKGHFVVSSSSCLTDTQAVVQFT